MAAPTEQPGEWYQIIGSAFAATVLAASTFFISYFNRKAKESPVEEVTSAGVIASRSIGAAFVDRGTADDIHIIRGVAERWEAREMAEEREELAELRRLAKEIAREAKKDPT